MSLISSAEFLLKGTGENRTLSLNLQGIVFLYFRQNTCPRCQHFDPIFKTIASQEKRMKFFVLDIDKDRKVVNMSKNTTTPINGVPMFIVYVNGNPYIKYTGERSAPSIKRFIDDALGKIKSTSGQFMSSQSTVGGPGQSGYNMSQMRSSSQGYYTPEGFNAQSYMKNNNFIVPEDEDNILLTPESILPYNKPWESEYKNL